ANVGGRRSGNQGAVVCTKKICRRAIARPPADEAGHGRNAIGRCRRQSHPRARDQAGATSIALQCSGDTIPIRKSPRVHSFLYYVFTSYGPATLATYPKLNLSSAAL